MAAWVQNYPEKLEKVELWRDKASDEYFFRLEYLCENESEVFRMIFPKVESGIPINRVSFNEVHSMFPGRDARTLSFNTSDNRHIVLPDEKGNYMYLETITEKIHEMTIEQIEKKLGYKVKIVSKKREEKK